MTRAWVLVAMLLAVPAGCGARTSSRTARLAHDLEGVLEEAPTTDAARRARDAIEATQSSEAAGRADEADEHASRARAWADVDVAEREIAALEEELGRGEVELVELEAAASQREADARALREASLARAEANAAREELARALLRAEADESTPRRARRTGLSEGPELARMADVLADRARVLAAAARGLGASPVPMSAVEQALARVDGATEATERLALADRAHSLARVALADARRSAGEAPNEAEIEALIEALRSEGFAPLRTEQGLGARVPDAFDGNAIATAMRGRLRRLAELIASHPHGPLMIAVEADDTREAQAQAQRRLAALRTAIVGSSERAVVVSIAVEVRVPGSPAPSAANAARVLLPAYVPRGPSPVSPPAPAEPAPVSDPTEAARL